MTGLPKHYLANHDVEEFYTVVERYKDNADIKEIRERISSN